MKFNLEEINLSLIEIGRIIDFGTNSILQNANKLASTRTYIEPPQLTELNLDWTGEFNHRNKIINGLQNAEQQTYWINEALRFIENELFRLPPKVQSSLRYVYDIENNILSKILKDLNLPHSYFYYKYLGKIRQLSRIYSGYQIGEPVNEENIFNWLKQFENPRKMELALCLLDAIEFVRIQDFYVKCQNFYRSLSDIDKNNLVVFQYGLPTEGSPAREKDFIDALKQCGKEFIIDKDVTANLKNLLAQPNHNQKIITIVDDIIGSGKQYSDIFAELFNSTTSTKYVPFENRLKTEEEKRRAKETKWLIIVYSCRADGKQRIEQSVFNKYQLNHSSIVPLSGTITNHCFRDNKNFKGEIIFEQEDDLKESMQMCAEIGISLDGDANKFGFLDSGQLIVFSHKTPNNTLPIFWKKGIHKKREWKPLFPRPEEI